MLGPVLYIILGGFRTNSQITTDPAGFPIPWEISNYIDVLTNSTFWREVGNSTIVALVTSVGVVALGLMASYVLARYSFRGRGALYALFAAGLMFPITVAITPLYILMQGPRAHQQPRRRHPAADRVRAADDDHHPGAVPARRSPTRSRRRRRSTAPAGSASSSGW